MCVCVCVCACVWVYSGVKSDNTEKKIDNKVIQAKGEFYWETKSTQ